MITLHSCLPSSSVFKSLQDGPIEPICSKQGFYTERLLDLNLWSRYWVQSHCTPSTNRYWKRGLLNLDYRFPIMDTEIEPNLVNFKEFNLLQTNENGWTDVDRQTDWTLYQKAAHFNKFEFQLLCIAWLKFGPAAAWISTSAWCLVVF